MARESYIEYAMKRKPTNIPALETLEIQLLTRESIAAFLNGRELFTPDDHTHARRRVPRWPFPGTVELWIPDGEGGERYELATCINLSMDGLGILADEKLPLGMILGIAFHQPEVSFHGRSVVRHVANHEKGFFTGVQFLYE